MPVRARVVRRDARAGIAGTARPHPATAHLRSSTSDTTLRSRNGTSGAPDRFSERDSTNRRPAMRNILKTSAAGLSLVLSLGALAAPAGTRTDGRRTLKLTEATEVLGSTVPPGSYELRWARERGSEAVRL